MNEFEISHSEETLGHTPLVADDDDREAGLIEEGDGLGNAREKFNIFPASYVLTFGCLAIDNPITIQKRGSGHGRVPVPPIRKQCDPSECGTPECGEFQRKGHKYKRPGPGRA